MQITQQKRQEIMLAITDVLCLNGDEGITDRVLGILGITVATAANPVNYKASLGTNDVPLAGSANEPDPKDIGRIVHRIKTQDGVRYARMDQSEYDGYLRGDFTRYAEYSIQPKRDFGPHGYYDAKSRSNIREGWVVVKQGCNAVPGAGWAHTKARAKQMIDVLCFIGDDPNAGQKFHHLMGAINAGRD